MLRVALLLIATNLFLAQSASAEQVICHENCKIYLDHHLRKHKKADWRTTYIESQKYQVIDRNTGFYLNVQKRHNSNMQIIERSSVHNLYSGSSSSDDNNTSSVNSIIWEGPFGSLPPRCFPAGPGTQTRLEEVLPYQTPCQVAPMPSVLSKQPVQQQVQQGSSQQFQQTF